MTGAKWFGYGEDALTYWALRTRLDCILDQLGDKSSECDTIVFYRPSFGRGGGANFGEFDAIIATPRSIYPIEAKWPGSREVNVKKKKIKLKSEQIMRHEIFAWYLEQYAKCQRQSWEHFEKLYGPNFCKKFPGKKLAPSTSKKLAPNIKFVLDRLLSIRAASTTTDVVLYLRPQGSPPVSSVYPVSFSLVDIAFVPKSEGGMFSL